MAEWLLVSLLFVCPLVAAEETAVYCKRVREFLRLLLRGSLMMPLRFLRSMTGESCLQLLRSWSSVRLPSDSPLDMVRSLRARVGGEGGKGAGVSEEGEQRPFLGPSCADGESGASPQLDQSGRPSTGRPPEASARTTAQASSTLFHGPSGTFAQGEDTARLPISSPKHSTAQGKQCPVLFFIHGQMQPKASETRLGSR